MAVLTNRLPATQRIAVDTKDSQATNNLVSTTTSQANQIWGFRVSQTLNALTVPNNSYQILGFDTNDYLTYSAPSANTNNFLWVSESIGGHTYPYSGFYAPQYGHYDIKLQITMTTAAVPAQAAIQFQAAINKNNAQLSYNYSVQLGEFGSATFNSCAVADSVLLNPNDLIQFYVYQETVGGASIATVAQDYLTFASVIYLGLN